MRTHFTIVSAAFVHPNSSLPSFASSSRHRRHHALLRRRPVDVHGVPRLTRPRRQCSSQLNISPCNNSNSSWARRTLPSQSLHSRGYNPTAGCSPSFIEHCCRHRPYTSNANASRYGNINSHLQPRQLQSTATTTTRLFGSKPGTPNAKPGRIFLSDDRDDETQSTISPIKMDMAALHRTIETARDIIGYPTYDVSLSLIDDEFMTTINDESRGINAPTDVLSFCFQDNFAEPGILGEVQFDFSDFYNLGDMLIDVDYVKRKCEEDMKLHVAEGRFGGENKNLGVMEGEVVSEENVGGSDAAQDGKDQEDEDSEDEYEYEYIEVETDEYDDRGVAPAMQYIYNPEVRIHMLVVHGMLHLVGYDHIEDDDYELMVEREDEVLAELRERLGDNFGVKSAMVLPEGNIAQN